MPSLDTLPLNLLADVARYLYVSEPPAGDRGARIRAVEPMSRVCRALHEPAVMTMLHVADVTSPRRVAKLLTLLRAHPDLAVHIHHVFGETPDEATEQVADAAAAADVCQLGQLAVNVADLRMSHGSVGDAAISSIGSHARALKTVSAALFGGAAVKSLRAMWALVETQAASLTDLILITDQALDRPLMGVAMPNLETAWLSLDAHGGSSIVHALLSDAPRVTALALMPCELLDRVSDTVAGQIDSLTVAPGALQRLGESAGRWPSLREIVILAGMATGVPLSAELLRSVPAQVIQLRLIDRRGVAVEPLAEVMADRDPVWCTNLVDLLVNWQSDDTPDQLEALRTLARERRGLRFRFEPRG